MEEKGIISGFIMQKWEKDAFHKEHHSRKEAIK